MEDTFGLQVISLRVDQLKIDDSYQRSSNTKRVDIIGKEFNPHIMGIIKVARRGDDWLVLDGQHRVLGLRKAYPSQQKDGRPIRIIVQIIPSDNAETEAVAYVEANTNQKPVTPDEKFKAFLRAGKRDHVLIHKLFASIGVKMEFGGNGRPAANITRSAGAAYDAFTKVGEHGFRNLIKLISLYQRPDNNGIMETHALQANFIRGLGYLLANCEDYSFEEIALGLKHGWSAADISLYANSLAQVELQTARKFKANMNGKTSREKTYAQYFEHSIMIGLKKGKKAA